MNVFLCCDIELVVKLCVVAELWGSCGSARVQIRLVHLMAGTNPILAG